MLFVHDAVDLRREDLLASARPLFNNSLALGRERCRRLCDLMVSTSFVETNCFPFTCYILGGNLLPWKFLS